MVRVPCTTESMPLNRRIFAPVQLASREALMLCSLPKQRHLLCCCSVQQSRSFFPLLSGIVLEFPGPMDANHCLRLVMVRSVCTVLADWSSNSTFQLLGSLICDCQIGPFFFMNFTHGRGHVGIVQAFVVVILIHGLENVNGVCSVLCLCRQTPLAQSTTFSAAPVKNDRSVIEACRRCQLAVTRVGVSRTLFIFGHRMRQFCCWVFQFRSGTLNSAPSEMTASVGSSNHWFFSPECKSTST